MMKAETGGRSYVEAKTVIGEYVSCKSVRVVIVLSKD